MSAHTIAAVPNALHPELFDGVVYEDGVEVNRSCMQWSVQAALRVASARRAARTGEHLRERLISVRVDGELDDALLADERDLAPSVTTWMRHVDAERAL